MQQMLKGAFDVQLSNFLELYIELQAPKLFELLDRYTVRVIQ